MCRRAERRDAAIAAQQAAAEVSRDAEVDQVGERRLAPPRRDRTAW
jgi:hypothetical protein